MSILQTRIAASDEPGDEELRRRYTLAGRPEQGLELAARLRVLEAQLHRIAHYRAAGKDEQVRILLNCYEQTHAELVAFLDTAAPTTATELRREIAHCLPQPRQLASGTPAALCGCGELARMIERVCHASTG